MAKIVETKLPLTQTATVELLPTPRAKDASAQEFVKNGNGFGTEGFGLKRNTRVRERVR